VMIPHVVLQMICVSHVVYCYNCHCLIGFPAVPGLTVLGGVCGDVCQEEDLHNDSVSLKQRKKATIKKPTLLIVLY